MTPTTLAEMTQASSWLSSCPKHQMVQDFRCTLGIPSTPYSRLGLAPLRSASRDGLRASWVKRTSGNCTLLAKPNKCPASSTSPEKWTTPEARRIFHSPAPAASLPVIGCSWRVPRPIRPLCLPALWWTPLSGQRAYPWTCRGNCASCGARWDGLALRRPHGTVWR